MKIVNGRIRNDAGIGRYTFMSFMSSRRSKALQSLCFLLYIVMRSLNKSSYLILGLDLD